VFVHILDFISLRNPQKGTRYVQAVVDVFMNHADKCNIVTMLEKVTF